MEQPEKARAATGAMMMSMEHFPELTAPRIARAQRHSLPDIVALTLGAALCGADHRGEIAELSRLRPTGGGAFSP